MYTCMYISVRVAMSCATWKLMDNLRYLIFFSLPCYVWGRTLVIELGGKYHNLLSQLVGLLKF